jgi:deoxyribonuclease IV
MLIGAHVSPAGGPANAVTRGEERGCRSIQIFNQSPRAWKARVYSDEEVAAFHEAMEASWVVEALVIHAVYLLNCASEDPEIRSKSLESLKVALNAGAQLGALGVVLHPGSALKDGGPVDEALQRAGEVIKEALAESETCKLLLEDTAGAGGTLGRSFEELAELIDLAGGDKRIGICLDSCHMYASGFDVATADKLTEVVESCSKIIGLRRLRCRHVNDSLTALGSNRDRHAPLGEGELGVEGCTAFLSEPRFDGLPCVFEGPGTAGEQVEAVDMAIAWRMRADGLKARSQPRAKARSRR